MTSNHTQEKGDDDKTMICDGEDEDDEDDDDIMKHAFSKLVDDVGAVAAVVAAGTEEGADDELISNSASDGGSSTEYNLDIDDFLLEEAESLKWKEGRAKKMISYNRDSSSPSSDFASLIMMEETTTLISENEAKEKERELCLMSPVGDEPPYYGGKCAASSSLSDSRSSSSQLVEPAEPLISLNTDSGGAVTTTASTTTTAPSPTVEVVKVVTPCTPLKPPAAVVAATEGATVTTSSTTFKSTRGGKSRKEKIIINDINERATYEEVEKNGPPLDPPPFPPPLIHEGEFTTITFQDEEEENCSEDCNTTTHHNPKIPSPSKEKKKVKALLRAPPTTTNTTSSPPPMMAYVTTKKPNKRINRFTTLSVYYILHYNPNLGCYTRPPSSRIQYVCVKSCRKRDGAARNEVSAMQYLSSNNDNNDSSSNSHCCHVLDCTEALEVGNRLYIITPHYEDLWLDSCSPHYPSSPWKNARDCNDDGGNGGKRNSPAMEAIARDLFKQILEGLRFMHRKGVCHGSLSMDKVKTLSSPPRGGGKCIVLVGFEDSLRIPYGVMSKTTKTTLTTTKSLREQPPPPPSSSFKRGSTLHKHSLSPPTTALATAAGAATPSITTPATSKTETKTKPSPPLRRLMKGQSWHENKSWECMCPEVFHSSGKNKKKRKPAGGDWVKDVDGIAADLWGMGVYLRAMWKYIQSIWLVSASSSSSSRRIKKEEERGPGDLLMGREGTALLEWMGQANPKDRPTVGQILNHEWMLKHEEEKEERERRVVANNNSNTAPVSIATNKDPIEALFGESSLDDLRALTSAMDAATLNRGGGASSSSGLPDLTMSPMSSSGTVSDDTTTMSTSGNFDTPRTTTTKNVTPPRTKDKMKNVLFRQSPPVSIPPHTPTPNLTPPTLPSPSSTTTHIPPCHEQEEKHEHSLTILDSQIRPTDVLFLRGGRGNKHPGSIRFRELCEKHQVAYVKARKVEKRSVAEQLVDEMIRGRKNDEGGGGEVVRFLKKETISTVTDTSAATTATKKKKVKKNEFCWVVLSREEAVRKTLQRFREGAPKLRKELGGSYVGTGVKSKRKKASLRR